MNGRRSDQLIAWLPVMLSMVFTAIALLPELRSLPSLNDDAFHFLLVKEAAAALERGDNVFDFWSPVLELGFPQFLYYQHIPHLLIVAIDRLLLGQVDLLTIFNSVRYLLLVGLPVTVYWSLRRMGFSKEGSVLAAAMSPLFAGNFNYGFEYDSYTWSGFGMYTQIWAMHLSFICLALLADCLDRGKACLAAVAVLALLILSHLVYAYMMAVSAGFMLLWGIKRRDAGRRVARFAFVWGAGALLTAYFWLPFLLSRVYLSASPYLQRWKYDSFGAGVILPRLVSGDLFDHGRLPVITLLAALGLVAALVQRSGRALFAAGFFLLWLALYFGRATWGALADWLPMHDGLIMHRFIGSVDIGALMLVASGGAWLWEFASKWFVRQRLLLFTVLAIALMLPAEIERAGQYRKNDLYMARTQAALDANPHVARLIARLKTLPPGRTFAGLRTDWGKDMKLGDLAFSDLLTFNQIPVVAPPYQSLSLNSDLLWDFDYRNPDDYRFFNVRYVVAPSTESMPDFLNAVERAGRYVLYEAGPSSYFVWGNSEMALSGRQSEFLAAARIWHRRNFFARGEFPEIRLDGAMSVRRDVPTHPLTEAGTWLTETGRRPLPKLVISDEVVGPQFHGAKVTMEDSATLVLKSSYHPNWHVTVDGREAQTMMVMPSYLGVNLPAGSHVVQIVYRGERWRTLLLLLSAAVTVVAVAVAQYRRRGAEAGPRDSM